MTHSMSPTPTFWVPLTRCIRRRSGLVLVANAETAKRILADAIPRLPAEPNWPEHRALDSALVTDRKLWPAATRDKLSAILGRFS